MTGTIFRSVTRPISLSHANAMFVEVYAIGVRASRPHYSGVSPEHDANHHLTGHLSHSFAHVCERSAAGRGRPAGAGETPALQLHTLLACLPSYLANCRSSARCGG